MKKNVRKIKVCWPALIAMAIAATVVSCNNEKMAEKHQNEIYLSNFASFEDSFEKSKFLLQNSGLEDGITSEETENETTNEAVFLR